jgi:hypothetical protein
MNSRRDLRSPRDRTQRIVMRIDNDTVSPNNHSLPCVGHRWSQERAQLCHCQHLSAHCRLAWYLSLRRSLQVGFRVDLVPCVGEYYLHCSVRAFTIRLRGTYLWYTKPGACKDQSAPTYSSRYLIRNEAFSKETLYFLASNLMQLVEFAGNL